MAALAILAASLERFATEIRNLARTEIREVQEYFAEGQKGSSAMPHKRNPWNCETVTGLARVVRGNLIPMLESMATWHERDLTNSSVERVDPAGHDHAGRLDAVEVRRYSGTA